MLTGKYIYIEASAPRKTGHKALLISPILDVGSACISFWYHMYGRGMGQLALYLKTDKRSYRMWRKAGNKGDYWMNAKVSISTKQKFQVSRVRYTLIKTFPTCV